MNLKEIIECLKVSEKYDDIDRYKGDIAEKIPAVRIMFNFDQQNRAHQYNLWEHSVHTVLNLPRDIDDDMLYLAALLHDIGKPDCQCEGKRQDDKNKHYYGHPLKSKQIVENEIIPLLENKGEYLSPKNKKRLMYYVEYHDDRVSLSVEHLKRHLKLATIDEFKRLMLLECADAKAHVMLPVIEKRIHICEQWLGDYGNQIFRKTKIKIRNEVRKHERI